MRRKVLAVTVGGEPDPVVKAIEQHRPDFVIFFATTEPQGDPAASFVRRLKKGSPFSGA